MRACILPCLLLLCAVSSSPAQSNDNFADRLLISGASTTVVSNNLHATREAGEPNHAGASAGRSLWWTWTAPTTGTVVFSTYNGSGSAPPLRALGVYTGSSLAALTEVASSNNDAQSSYLAGADPAYSTYGGGSAVNVQVKAGQVYQIAVDALASSDIGSADDGTVALSINAAPTVVSAANVTAGVGAAFSYAVRASGNPTAYTASGLPGGLSFNASSGVISGVPTTAGSYPVGLSATGPGGTGTATLTLRVDDAVPASSVVPLIYSAATARGYPNAAFSYNLLATGSPATFTATNLPAGLSLNAQTGAITGTPTAIGDYGVGVSATGPGGTGTASLVLGIRPAAPPVYVTGPLMVTATLKSNFSYTLPLTASDPAAPYGSMDFSGTNLPPGLTLVSNGAGIIKGAPTQAGVFSVPITVAIGGVSRQTTLTITVADPAAPAASARPVLNSAAAATASVGTSFSYQLTATNAPSSFSVTQLPAGLAFDPKTNLITGTPATAGTYTSPVSATNGDGTSTGTLTITVNPKDATAQGGNGYALPVITSPAMAVAYTGQSFNYQVAANYQGVAYLPSGAYWTFSADSLPPGLTMTSSSSYGTAAITGTPTTPGTYPVTLTAVYPASSSISGSATSHPAAAATAVVNFLVKAGPQPTLPVITSPAAASFIVGSASSYQTTASGGATGFAATGLPPGLGIAANNGSITGTPTTAGTYPARISATNSVGTITVTVTFIVAPIALPIIASSAVAYATVGSSVNYAITAQNGAGSYGASNLPPGLSLNPTNGYITGTPTAAGVYTVPISATGSGGTANATLTYTISTPTTLPPFVTSNPLAIATIGQYFYTSLYAGTASATFSAGSLPPGLSLNPTSGLISGTPTALGKYTVPVSATNSVGTCTATLTIVVTNPPAPVLGSYASSNATSGQAYSYYLGVNNGVPASFAVTGLPNGLSYNATTSYITGTPTTTGISQVAISASNVSGTSSGTLTLTVNPTAGAPVFQYGPSLAQSLAVGTSYSQSVAATPNVTNYTATNLPPGLGLNATSGLISGTPTTAGTYPSTITATNSVGSVSVKTAFGVAPAVTSAPTFSLLPATVTGYAGIVFPSTALSATNNGGAPISSYAASGLPEGLAFDPATGVISGTPTTMGQYSVAVSVGNTAGTNTAVLTVVIRDPMLLVPVFNYGQSLQESVLLGSTPNFHPTASAKDQGGNTVPTPLNFSVTGLPPGLTAVASSNGVSLQGTPTAAGESTITVTATVPGGRSASAMVVLRAIVPVAPLVSNGAELAGNVDLPFSDRVYGSQTVTSYTAGALPPGLRLNTATGQITGTPTTVGTYPVNVSVNGPNGTGAAEITIRIEPPIYGGLPVITSAAAVGSQEFPPDGTASSFFLYAQPSTAVNYALTALNKPSSLTMGTLPAGLSFNPATGILAGTPTVTGLFRIPVSATNAVGTASATLTIISTSPLPLSQTPLAYECYVGGTCNLTTAAAFPANTFPTFYQLPPGYLPYTPPAVTYQASGLPPGLSLHTASGAISGVATQAGTYPVMLSATDRAGTSSAVVTVYVAGTKPADTLPGFTSAATVIGYTNVPLDYRLNAPGGAQYTTTSLPGGLALNPATGAISGTPAVAGTFVVPVYASNSAGTTAAMLTFQLENALLPPTVTSPAAYAATLGQPFSGRIVTANLATMPAVTGYSAVLPDGLELNPATGEMSGVPTGPAGTYTIYVSLYHATRLSTAFAQTFTILPAPDMPPLPVLGTAAGSLAFVGNPYLYTIRSRAFAPTGSLPAGLVYDALAGTIKGYPTAAGTYLVPLAASNDGRGLPAAGSRNRTGPSRSGKPTGASSTVPSPNGSGAADALLTLRVTAPALSPPQFTVQPTNVVVARGQAATLTATAAGAPAPGYQWSRNGVPIAGATGDSLSSPSAASTDTGTYTVTAANTAGTLVSTPVTLLVLTTFAQWQGDYFSAAEMASGIAASDQDASGDGILNLLKYALGLNPRVNNSGALPVATPTSAAGGLQITFDRDTAKTDINYLVEASQDLHIWTTVAQSAAGLPTVASGGAGSVVETTVAGTSRSHVTVYANPPATAGKQFLRLRVTRP